MLNIFLLKTLCQLSLYFIFVRLIADIMELRLARGATIIFFMIVLLVSFFLRDRTWPWRVAPLALLGGLVPFASVGDWVFVIVPVLLFSLYVTLKRRYTIDDDAFRSVSGVGLMYMAVMGFLSAVSAGTGAGFLLIAVVCGIALSRDLRHDVSTLEDSVYRVMSFGVIFVVISAAFFLTSGAVRRLVIAALRGILWLYFALVGRLPEDVDMSFLDDMAVPFWGPGAETDDDGYEYTYGYYEFTGRGAILDIISAYGVIFVTATLLIVLLFIFAGIRAARRIFLAHGKQSDGQTLRREHIEGAFLRHKKTPDKLSGYSGAVRRYYRRFIKLITKNGARLLPHHTSQDLEGISSGVLGDYGHDLRSVYIRARYSTDEITKADTVMAKEALRRLKSGKGA